MATSRFTMGIALAACAVAFGACGSDDEGSATSGASSKAAGGEPVTLTLAYFPASTNACLKVTDERGVFKKHGLTIKYGTAAPTGAASIAQVLNGEITVGGGAYTGVITAVSNNLPVVITNAQTKDQDEGGQTALATIVGKDSRITSFRQLEGKTVAVNSLQGTWEVALKEAVARQGGDPSKVKLVAVPFPDQAAALRSRRVDAVSTLQPFIAQLNADGYKSIGDPQAIMFGKTDSVTNVSFMSREFVEANPEAAAKFVRAQQEGNEWCNAHPEEMREAIARITKTPMDVVKSTPVPVVTASVDPAETDVWSKALVKYGIIKTAPPAERVQWSGAAAQ